MTEPSSSAPSTSREPPKPGTSTELATNKSEISVDEDWKIFTRLLNQSLASKNVPSPDGVPKRLEKLYTPEQWNKLSAVKQLHLRRECAGDMSAAAANKLLLDKGVQRSKTTIIGTLPMAGIPEMLEQDQSGALRKVDVFEDYNLAVDSDDTGVMTRGLPDWVIPKNLLLRSFYQFRAQLDAKSEERFMENTHLIFDDDPLMREEPDDTPKTPATFKLRALKMTDFEWDDYKKEKRVPILNKNPEHPSIKNKPVVVEEPLPLGKKKRKHGKKYWEHKMKPSEIARLSDPGISDENPIIYHKMPGAAALQGREYVVARDYMLTVKKTRAAIAYLDRRDLPFTEESIKDRVDYLDRKLALFRKAFRRRKRKVAKNPSQEKPAKLLPKKKVEKRASIHTPRVNKEEYERQLFAEVARELGEEPEAMDVSQPISGSLSVAIPKETSKSSTGSPPLSPSKRVLPARTRRPTVKEAERRTDSQLRSSSRRSHGSKERDEPPQPSPATSTAASGAESTVEAGERPDRAAGSSTEVVAEKEKSEGASAKSKKRASAKAVEKKKEEEEQKKPRKQGIPFPDDEAFLEEEEKAEEQIVGKSKTGEDIVLVQRESGWSIRFDNPVNAKKNEPPKKIQQTKKPSVEFEPGSSDEDEDAPSTEELTKMHPSELIIYRNRRGEVRLAPRCCLADQRDGAWIACKRPGRNDVMTAALAKRAYEMDLHIAWRYKAYNQRICMLHSRVIRNAGFGGNILEEMIPWMGRRACTDLEKQLVGTELTTPFAELEKQETKWLNWDKPMSAQILMQKMKEVNKDAYAFLNNLRYEQRMKRVKRVRRVPIGMKKKDRAFAMAEFFLDHINIDDLTEEDVAALSGKERRALAELIRVNTKREEHEEKDRQKWFRRWERRQGADYRPMSPVSCDSVPGSSNDFEKTIGPLIQCMIRRPRGDWTSKVRKIRKIPAISRRERRRKAKRVRRAKLKKAAMKRAASKKIVQGAGKRKKAKKTKKTIIPKIVTLESGEQINLAKFRRLGKGLRPIVRKIKRSSPDKKLYAIESLVGRKIPELKEVIYKERLNRQLCMLDKREYVTISLKLHRAKKMSREEYVVVGMMNDRAAQRRTLNGLRPVLFLAYRKGDKSKNVVKLMPRLLLKAMREIKQMEPSEPQRFVETIDLTGPKEQILKMRASNPAPIHAPRTVRRKVKKPMKKRPSHEEKKMIKAQKITNRLNWIKMKIAGIKAREEKERADEDRRRTVMGERRRVVLEAAAKKRKEQQEKARALRATGGRRDEPMEIDESIEKRDEEIEFLGVTKKEVWVHPMLKEMEEERQREEEKRKEVQKKRMEEALTSMREELRQGNAKKNRTRLRLYLRPGVIVIRAQHTRRKLNEIKKACLQKMKDLPNSNKILDKIVLDSIKQICTKPARREITQEDIDEAKSNPAETKLRELWMDEIDHCLREYGCLPLEVPVQYIEERNEELKERLTINLQVEERLFYEEQRQRLRDEIAAAEEAIFKDSDEEEKEREEDDREEKEFLDDIVDDFRPAVECTRTTGSRLQQVPSVYDKLKDERTYWTEREDERWRKEAEFKPALRRVPPVPAYDADAYDEIKLTGVPPRKIGHGKRLRVPKGAVLMETALTKSMGQVPKKRKIRLRRLLRKIDTRKLTLAQKKKMIAGLKKLKAQRQREQLAKPSVQRSKKLPSTKEPSLDEPVDVEMIEEPAVAKPLLKKPSIAKPSIAKPSIVDSSIADATVDVPMEVDIEAPVKEPVKSSRRIIFREPELEDALEWSMAQPSWNEITRQLKADGVRNRRQITKEKIRIAIGNLRDLKQRVYEQLRPMDGVKEGEAVTVKIRSVTPPTEPKLPMKAAVKVENKKVVLPKKTVKVRKAPPTVPSAAPQKSALKTEKKKLEEMKRRLARTVQKSAKRSEKALKENTVRVEEKLERKDEPSEKKDKKKEKKQPEKLVEIARKVEIKEKNVVDKEEKTKKKQAPSVEKSSIASSKPKSVVKSRYNWDAPRSTDSGEQRLFLVRVGKPEEEEEVSKKKKVVEVAEKVVKVGKKEKEVSKKAKPETEKKLSKEKASKGEKEKKTAKKIEESTNKDIKDDKKRKEAPTKDRTDKTKDKTQKKIKIAKITSRKDGLDAEMAVQLRLAATDSTKKDRAEKQKERMKEKEIAQKEISKRERLEKERAAQKAAKLQMEQEARQKADEEALRAAKRARGGYESEDERERYREQKRAAIEGRKAMMGEIEEKEEEIPVLEVKKRSHSKRRRETEEHREDREHDEIVTVDGQIVAKKRRKQVDPTGFSLLPTRTIYRYRAHFGLPREEGDTRAALVFGAQHHFKKLEASSSAIPYFCHALASGGNYLDEKDARHLRRQLEAQRQQAEQLAAAGLSPETPPPTRGTRYRVAANQRKQLVEETEKEDVVVDNDDESQSQ